MADKTEKKASKLPEIAATSLATLTSALVGSLFGIAGTMVGLAFGSLISGLATEIYKHWFTKAHDSLKNRLTKKDASAAPSPRDIRITERRADGYTGYFSGVLQEAPPKKTSQDFLKRLNWKWAIAVTAITFVVGFGSISLIEVAKGSPISGGNSGTTISGLLGNSTQTPTTTHRPTETDTSTETTTEKPLSSTETTTITVPRTTTSSPATSSSQSSSETTNTPTSSVAPTTTAGSQIPQAQITQTK